MVVYDDANSNCGLELCLNGSLYTLDYVGEQVVLEGHFGHLDANQDLHLVTSLLHIELVCDFVIYNPFGH